MTGDFIRANTRLAAPPATPEITLYLATEITPLWLATEEFLHLNNLAPPFWAFPWVGGQGLARYILDRPEIVAGKHVLDFASGSGIVAIAAMQAGAASVDACDIDPMACTAIRLNSLANHVVVTARDEDLLAQETEQWDIILAGDVCYERPMAERVFSWMQRRVAAGAQVLMADPGRNYLPDWGLIRRAEITIACSLEIEDRTSRTVVLYDVTAEPRNR